MDPATMDYTLRSRWRCPIPAVDLTTYIFTSATHPLPSSTAQYISAASPSEFLTQQRTRQLVQRLALGLLHPPHPHHHPQHSFRRGDRVLVFSPNSIYYPVAFLGVVAAEGVFTGANPAYTARELAFQLRDSGATLVLCAGTEEVLRTAVAAADAAAVPRANLWVFDERVHGVGAAEAHALRARWGVGGHWTQLLAREDEAGAFRWRTRSTMEECEATAAINYSSGTTGVPKGVLISHRNFVANAEQALYLSALSPAKNALPKRWLGVLPMYHAYGQTYVIMIAPRRQIPVYVMARFDLEQYLAHAQRYRITELNCVPPIAVALAKHPAVDRFDLSSVRFVGCGAAPLSADVAVEVCERLKKSGGGTGDSRDLVVKQGWGMTEATCSVLGHHPDDTVPDYGAVGELLPNCEAKVIPATLSPSPSSTTTTSTTSPTSTPATTPSLPANTPGEILVRGPQVTAGYHNNPSATATLFTPDGWLRTGDVGYYDPTGKFYIVDRIKELIKVRGLQVAPAELEGVLLEHPAVADAAVVGVPLRDDEGIRAYVVRKNEGAGGEVGGEVGGGVGGEVGEGEGGGGGGGLDQTAVENWIRAKCVRHKWITAGVVFIDAVPKNPSGKILRRELRERAKREMAAASVGKSKL